MDFIICMDTLGGNWRQWFYIMRTFVEGILTMKAFQIFLVVVIIGIVSITAIVISRHGMNLLPIFFGDMAALTWPGQFNFDFLCFLLLSGLWLAWRHHFSAGGILLGLAGVFGGIMLLAPYLLVASFKANGDVKMLLLGRRRAGS